jgi:transposase InsO family protein
LGGVPRFSQTDQSSTATHQLKRGESRRVFNDDYVALLDHLKMEPRTIAVACPNQNGDVEAFQGVLKRRLKNQLILRRSRDFASVAAYAAFVATVCRGVNALRGPKLAEERALLRPLPHARYPDTDEATVRLRVFGARAAHRGSDPSSSERGYGALCLPRGRGRGLPSFTQSNPVH